MALLNIHPGSKVKFLDKVKIGTTSTSYGYGSEGSGGSGSSLTTNLQAFYRLSDTTDSSGNSNTLTNNGSVSFSTGKIGNAASTESGKYLSTGVINLNGVSAFTLSCWLKRPSNGSGDQAIFGSTNSGIVQRASIFAHNNSLYAAAVTSNNGYKQVGGTAFNNNTWYHTALVYDGSFVKFYINGNAVGSIGATGTVIAVSDFFGLGAGASGTKPFTGQIDAAGVWTRALSDTEVGTLYGSGNGYEV